VITYKLNGGFDQNALEILTDYAYTAKLIVKYPQVGFSKRCNSWKVN